MMLLKTARSPFLNRWLRSSAIAVALAAACMMFGTATLKADCGVSAKHLMGSVFKPSAFITMAAEGHHESDRDHASVVGFWHVKLVKSDGSLLFQSIVQFHPDGSEFENAFIPVLGQDFCMGIWKNVGHNTVEIYHIALAHDAATGVPVGYAIFTQKNVLDHDGDSYSGTFTYTQYDLNNNEVTNFSGTTEAHRIDFHHPFALY